MKNYLGRIILLLEDYEKAASFYEENFGFIKMFDVTTDVGKRFLHMGAGPLDTLGIWLFKSGHQRTKRADWQSNKRTTNYGCLYYFIGSTF